MLQTPKRRQHCEQRLRERFCGFDAAEVATISGNCTRCQSAHPIAACSTAFHVSEWLQKAQLTLLTVTFDLLLCFVDCGHACVTGRLAYKASAECMSLRAAVKAECCVSVLFCSYRQSQFLGSVSDNMSTRGTWVQYTEVICSDYSEFVFPMLCQGVLAISGK